jgi:hypothetical protein
MGESMASSVHYVRYIAVKCHRVSLVFGSVPSVANVKSDVLPVA